MIDAYVKKFAEETFPSPCGDMVLKFCHHFNLTDKFRMFPSPCGDSPILASPVATGEVARNASRWGALVPCVHFCRYGWFTACVHGAPSTAYAVPLPRSGRGGWRYAPSPCGDMVLKYRAYSLKRIIFLVSVPLRGYGFEIASKIHYPYQTLQGFRPLAGIWF